MKRIGSGMLANLDRQLADGKIGQAEYDSPRIEIEETIRKGKDIDMDAGERVRVATARWLLPDLDAIADALADSTPENAALDLWVADDILATRLVHLTAGERGHISRTAAA